MQRKASLTVALDNWEQIAKTPVATQSAAIWDLNVNIKSSAPFTRLASLNHPIQVQFCADKMVANIRLADSIDKKLVPCRDFVLLYRDAAMESADPTAVSTIGQSGH